MFANLVDLALGYSRLLALMKNEALSGLNVWRAARTFLIIFLWQIEEAKVYFAPLANYVKIN